MRLRKGIKWWIAPACLVVAAPIAAVIYGAASQFRSQDDISYLKKEGLKFEPLPDWVAPPRDDAENASIDYHRAANNILGPNLAAYNALKATDIYGRIARKPLGYGARATTTAYQIEYGALPHPAEPKVGLLAAKKLSADIAVARAGLGKSVCIFGSNAPSYFLKVGGKYYFPGQQLGTIENLLMLKGIDEILVGDADQGSRDVTDSLRVAKQAISGGREFNDTYEACRFDVLQRLSVAALKHPNDSKILAGIVKVLDQFPEPKSMRQSVFDSLTMHLRDLQFANEDPTSYTESTYATSQPPFLADAGPIMRFAASQSFHSIRTAVELLPKDVNGYSATLSALQKGEKQWSRQWPQRSHFASPFTEAFQSLSDTALTLNGERLLQMRIRLLNEKAQKGAFPKELPNYGDCSRDAYTSQPFHYKPTANGFVVYSVGTDLIDDGGDCSSYDGYSAGPDQTVRYP